MDKTDAKLHLIEGLAKLAEAHLEGLEEVPGDERGDLRELTRGELARRSAFFLDVRNAVGDDALVAWRIAELRRCGVDAKAGVVLREVPVAAVRLPDGSFDGLEGVGGLGNPDKWREVVAASRRGAPLTAEGVLSEIFEQRAEEQGKRVEAPRRAEVHSAPAKFKDAVLRFACDEPVPAGTSFELVSTVLAHFRGRRFEVEGGAVRVRGVWAGANPALPPVFAEDPPLLGAGSLEELPGMATTVAGVPVRLDLVAVRDLPARFQVRLVGQVIAQDVRLRGAGFEPVDVTGALWARVGDRLTHREVRS